LIVVDASAAVEWLLQTTAGRRIQNRVRLHPESLHAPHLLDIEVLHVLRRLVRGGAVAPHRAEQAIEDLLNLRIARYPHSRFLPCTWRYRDSLSAYDAAYVALAEALGAVLITRDRRLAAAAGHAARIELF
jgi:predicted nucleic acid-binding protein